MERITNINKITATNKTALSGPVSITSESCIPGVRFKIRECEERQRKGQVKGERNETAQKACCVSVEGSSKKRKRL